MSEKPIDWKALADELAEVGSESAALLTSLRMCGPEELDLFRGDMDRCFGRVHDALARYAAGKEQQ